MAVIARCNRGSSRLELELRILTLQLGVLGVALGCNCITWDCDYNFGLELCNLWIIISDYKIKTLLSNFITLAQNFVTLNNKWGEARSSAGTGRLFSEEVYLLPKPVFKKSPEAPSLLLLQDPFSALLCCAGILCWALLSPSSFGQRSASPWLWFCHPCKKCLWYFRHCKMWTCKLCAKLTTTLASCGLMSCFPGLSIAALFKTGSETFFFFSGKKHKTP